MLNTPGGRYAASAQEDRSGQRTKITAPVTLLSAGAEPLRTNLTDISISGFAAVAVDPIKRGTRLSVTLAGNTSRSARVVWSAYGLIGCAFETLLSKDDLDKILNRCGMAQAPENVRFSPSAPAVSDAGSVRKQELAAKTRADTA